MTSAGSKSRFSSFYMYAPNRRIGLGIKNDPHVADRVNKWIMGVALYPSRRLGPLDQPFDIAGERGCQRVLFEAIGHGPWRRTTVSLPAGRYQITA